METHYFAALFLTKQLKVIQKTTIIKVLNVIMMQLNKHTLNKQYKPHKASFIPEFL